MTICHKGVEDLWAGAHFTTTSENGCCGSTSVTSAPFLTSADLPVAKAEGARHRSRFSGRGTQTSIRPFLRSGARPKTATVSNFTLSPDLGMTDAAQSLLMHDVLETDSTTPPNSQHSN